MPTEKKNKIDAAIEDTKLHIVHYEQELKMLRAKLDTLQKQLEMLVAVKQDKNLK